MSKKNKTTDIATYKRNVASSNQLAMNYHKSPLIKFGYSSQTMEDKGVLETVRFGEPIIQSMADLATSTLVFGMPGTNMLKQIKSMISSYKAKKETKQLKNELDSFFFTVKSSLPPHQESRVRTCLNTLAVLNEGPMSDQLYLDICVLNLLRCCEIDEAFFHFYFDRLWDRYPKLRLSSIPSLSTAFLMTEQFDKYEFMANRFGHGNFKKTVIKSNGTIKQENMPFLQLCLLEAAVEGISQAYEYLVIEKGVGPLWLDEYGNAENVAEFRCFYEKYLLNKKLKSALPTNQNTISNVAGKTSSGKRKI
ncbi:TPA: hypothetical protein ACK3Q6_002643 [Burkholderia cepacia]|uniref:hypothetical protein n=1 Tax=Burkholderia cepacia TaxID=292 RepID=UPI001CF16C4F|nr:hypothetical protein [Burkholderia cepacia]HDR9763584.1 hypothetical protein [Burkholderia cepacia ATCC 25416]MCA8361248.1 hypothetical protein [Burkholderia cepacia]HDR9771140.1 hypothetical protein [Burkholderia cepacia ATCC 25416]HDR9778944.1 hypothetical protein [Burkholderia cepacia ATCC 25416]HDR9785794.1 hypothetical protein [Burkholderia cepacia ATCC 25416]